MQLRPFPRLQFIFLFVSTVHASSSFRYNVLNGADFPDPSIIYANGISYAFSTIDGDTNVPIIHNDSFDNASGWSGITDAFPVDNVPAFG